MSAPPPRANIYVDGFNLYYLAVKGTKLKWLDISKMCAHLRPTYSIHRIKYFTANIVSRSGDPQQAARQEIYLRALRTIPHTTIIRGTFLSHVVSMPEADPSTKIIKTDPATGATKYSWVMKTEEKGSDVNLATHLLNDGYKKDYDVAIVVSNDSDLTEPIRIVTRELKLRVDVLTPQRDSKVQSRQLRKVASSMTSIDVAILAASQFPNTLTDKVGTFYKPPKW